MKFMNLKEQMVIEMKYDENAESPRAWDCNLGTIYTWESRSISPDEHSYGDAITFLEEILGENVVTKLHDKHNNTADFMNEIIKRVDQVGYVMNTVSRYEHSGVKYFLGSSSGWDTGTVGVIFSEKETIRELLGVKRINAKVREMVEKDFIAELEAYTDWCNGEVYGYEVSDLGGNVIDSCWGFMDCNVYDEKQVFELVNENYSIGELSDFEEYDIEKINELFEIKLVVTPR